MRPPLAYVSFLTKTAPLVGLAVAALLISSPAIAGAEDAPAGVAPTTTPAAASGNANVSNPAAATGPLAQPVGHLPVIDVVPVFTQPLDYANRSQIHHYQPLDVGGTVRIPITHDFSLFFDRVIGGTLDVPLAREGPILPGYSRDILLLYHGTYTLHKYLTFDVGYAFRHRAYNNDTSGVSGAPFPATISSTEGHYGIAGVSYATHPVRGLLNSVFTFTEQVQTQAVDHDVAIVCTAAQVQAGVDHCAAPGLGGLLDENPHQNRYYTTSQTAAVTLPIDVKHGVVLSYSDLWGALSWYENAPFPYRYTGVEQLLLAKRFNPVFSLALRARQYYQVPQGAPFPAPSVIHLGSLDAVASFHVDLNQVFH
jgi:hypothetical protein